MKHIVATLSVLFISSLGLAERSAHADPAWRCVDEPGQQDCQEALINDIEDVTLATWPGSFTLAMPGIPYSCSQQAGGPIDPRVKARVVNRVMPWSTTWTGTMRSFLIGRHTADADLALSVTASVLGESQGLWAGNTANFLFNESASEVPSPGGPTGVVDLGAVSFSTLTGPLWGESLLIHIELGDGNWTCTVGPPGHRVIESGRNGVVDAAYPISFTDTQERLAEAVRNQFRTSVRLIVTGSP